MEKAKKDKWLKIYGKDKLSELHAIVDKAIEEFSMNDCDLYLDLFPNGGEKSREDIAQRKKELERKPVPPQPCPIPPSPHPTSPGSQPVSPKPFPGQNPTPSPSVTLKDVGEWIGGVVVLILFVGVVMLFVWKPSKKDVPYPHNKYSSCYKCNGTGCVQLGKSDIYCYFYGGLLKIKCSNCRGKGYTRNPLYHGDEYLIVGDDGELYSIDVD